MNPTFCRPAALVKLDRQITTTPSHHAGFAPSLNYYDCKSSGASIVKRYYQTPHTQWPPRGLVYLGVSTTVAKVLRDPAIGATTQVDGSKEVIGHFEKFLYGQSRCAEERWI